MTNLEMQEVLPERYLADIFRTLMQITSPISLDRLQPVVTWEILNPEMWQMYLAIPVS